MAFDSFDDLTSSDPRDGALEVMGLPWRVDGRSAEILRDRHGIDLGELLESIQEVVGGVDEDVLKEHGIDSADDLQKLSDEEREAVAEASTTNLGGMMSAAVSLLHAGWVRFEPGLTREQVQAAVDLPALTDLPIEQMVRRIMPSEDKSAPAVEDGQVGK